MDDTLEEILEDFRNELICILDGYRWEVDELARILKGRFLRMALDQSTLALLQRIDAATNGIASRIQAFVDSAIAAGGATPAEINAALQPEVDRLEHMANDPANPTPLGISIAPTSTTVAPGATQQFTATVTGGDPSSPPTLTGAKYSARVGVVDSTGLYTAPAVAPPDGLDTVTAVAKADSSISASAAITIGEIPVK
jgi:hypothetical protein